MFGGVILFDTDVEAFQVAWPLLAAIGVVSGAFIIITITIAMRMRHQHVTTGVEQLVGSEGTALGGGQVRVGSEIWEAHSDDHLEAGDAVVVREVKGLKLFVDKEQS